MQEPCDIVISNQFTRSDNDESLVGGK